MPRAWELPPLSKPIIIFNRIINDPRFRILGCLFRSPFTIDLVHPLLSSLLEDLQGHVGHPMIMWVWVLVVGVSKMCGYWFLSSIRPKSILRHQIQESEYVVMLFLEVSHTQCTAGVRSLGFRVMARHRGDLKWGLHGTDSHGHV